ncbi:beta-L-arabinofuranosidase domain-containing protein [Anaerobium acetethylicum]|uniref:Non-reducing end beta-L-arabinofuranosidase-like GH127 C-terminal domain-containing protein n=1 Tax=Anaerobium acetethylicum TaxID=1619234 RepID=A0A1D3TWV0_9FIRM|nr:beta-L-arabinofuranosidase domain-containing protein [Anaerobium acetethylicum]SCP98756.1 hypothetical protein SAMN05421730_102541 [Anaerobium acetethylicum]
MAQRIYQLDEKDETGYLTVKLELVEGEEVQILFDMPVRLTQAHNMVEETVGQAAVERGPLVYCMEGMDAPVETLDDLMLDLNARFMPVSCEIAGRKTVALEGNGYQINRNQINRNQINRNQYNRDSLYQTMKQPVLEPVSMRLVPYFAWDNRGYDEMRIWIPVAYR